MLFNEVDLFYNSLIYKCKYDDVNINRNKEYSWISTQKTKPVRYSIFHCRWNLSWPISWKVKIATFFFWLKKKQKIKLAFLSNYDKYRLVYINHHFDNIVTKSILWTWKKDTHTQMACYIEAIDMGNRLHCECLVCVCLSDIHLNLGKLNRCAIQR